MRHKLLSASAVFALAALLPTARAEAQTTAVGPYYATPSWDQTLPCTTLTNCSRFVVLSNMGNAAVLDRETGLVWERSPNTEQRSWRAGQVHCNEFTTYGNRFGWRLPTLQELGSLVDTSRMSPALPAGHPFLDVQLSGYYFTATDDSRDIDNKWAISFFDDGDISNGASHNKELPHFTWCVRGGQGHNPQ